jgi:hypothetical protein
MGLLLSCVFELTIESGPRCDQCDRNNWRGPLCEKGNHESIIYSFANFKQFAPLVFEVNAFDLASANVRWVLLEHHAILAPQDIQESTAIFVRLCLE